MPDDFDAQFDALFSDEDVDTPITGHPQPVNNPTTPVVTPATTPVDNHPHTSTPPSNSVKQPSNTHSNTPTVVADKPSTSTSHTPVTTPSNTAGQPQNTSGTPSSSSVQPASIFTKKPSPNSTPATTQPATNTSDNTSTTTSHSAVTSPNNTAGQPRSTPTTTSTTPSSTTGEKLFEHNSHTPSTTSNTSNTTPNTASTRGSVTPPNTPVNTPASNTSTTSSTIQQPSQTPGDGRNTTGAPTIDDPTEEFFDEVLADLFTPETFTMKGTDTPDNTTEHAHTVTPTPSNTTTNDTDIPIFNPAPTLLPTASRDTVLPDGPLVNPEGSAREPTPEKLAETTEEHRRKRLPDTRKQTTPAEYGDKSKRRNGTLRDKGPAEMLTNERGDIIGDAQLKANPDRFAKLVEAAKNNRGFNTDTITENHADDLLAAPDPQIYYPWKSPRIAPEADKKQKLSEAEKAFYKALGSTRAQGLPVVLEPLTNPSATKQKSRRALGNNQILTTAGNVAAALGTANQYNVSFADIQLLTFIAKFRWTSAQVLRHIHSWSERTTLNHLSKLEKLGFIRSHNIWGTSKVYSLTQMGLDTMGYTYHPVMQSDISYPMLAHATIVGYVAANLWGGHVNVCNLDPWPVKNRNNAKGQPIYGEQVISENEIQSAYSRIVQFDAPSGFRSQIQARINHEFTEWERRGGIKAGMESPEFAQGNEYMWMLWPELQAKMYHAPDLVLRRPRNIDGTPNSIAIEVERSLKADKAYNETLNNYMDDKRLYKQVIWIVLNNRVGNAILKAAHETGLYQAGRIQVLPIITLNGYHEGRDIWTL